MDENITTEQATASVDAVAKRDPNMDLVSLLQATPTPHAAMHTPTDAEQPAQPQEVAPVEAPEQQPKKQMTAIEKAIAAKKNSSGLFTDRKAAAEEAAPLRMAYDTDEAREEFESELAGMLDRGKKAAAVVCVRKPTNPAEYADMITEIDLTTIDKDGRAIVPEGAKYIVARTPEITARIEEIKAREAAGEPIETVSDDAPVEVNDAREEYRQNFVKILIDKTGMGANIEFDDEDKKAIELANVVQLCEVEDQDLAVIEVEREDESTSFMQAIEARQLSLASAPMVFPGSGFHAQMTGLTWGEYADITLDTQSDDSDDYINFDKLYKRYSVIYNHMKNISIGKFKDFEDFLKNFAYNDTELALYGLTIATQPDVDQLYINCMEDKCHKRFLYKFRPRDVIEFDTAPTLLLQQVDAIMKAGPDERWNIYKNSHVHKNKRVRLDMSGWVVDIGFCSAYDHLYTILPLLKEYASLEDVDDNDPRADIPIMLTGVRKVYVPTANGKYAPTKTIKDIEEALLALPPRDFAVLKNAIFAYQMTNGFSFSLKNLKCPYCKHVTKRLPINVDTLVFQTRLHQSNMRITVKNFQDI